MACGSVAKWRRSMSAQDDGTEPTELSPAELASESEVAVDTGDDGESPVMELLSEHVPLSLIIDLSAPAGPDSEQILDEEGEPDDAWWEPIA
jgi:hypothetical protein